MLSDRSQSISTRIHESDEDILWLLEALSALVLREGRGYRRLGDLLLKYVLKYICLESYLF